MDWYLTYLKDLLKKFNMFHKIGMLLNKISKLKMFSKTKIIRVLRNRLLLIKNMQNKDNYKIIKMYSN